RTLDHAGRAANAAAEFGPGIPDHAMIVVAPPVLHLAGSQHAYQLEIALRAVVALYQACAAVGDVAAELDADMPASPVPPAMGKLAVLGQHHDLEVARRVVVALDETGHAHCIVGTENPSIVPWPSGLLEPPVM